MGGCSTYPLVATLFMLAALSLAGMPPLSGFFAKLALLTAGVQEAQYGYVSVALLGSLLTLVSMSKIYVYVFWGEAETCAGGATSGSPSASRLPRPDHRVVGPHGRTCFQLAQQAATQLFSRPTSKRSLPPRKGQMMAGLLLLNLILALTWAALQGELNAANLVIGFLVSAALIYLFRRMFFRPLYFRKGVLGLTLALVFIKELIKSNIAVLRVVLNPWLRVRSGVIAVPTELTNDVALTMLANMITLTPGTLTLDISPDRRYLYVHTLNLDDPEEVKQEIRQAFEVYLRELSR